MTVIALRIIPMINGKKNELSNCDSNFILNIIKKKIFFGVYIVIQKYKNIIKLFYIYIKK